MLSTLIRNWLVEPIIVIIDELKGVIYMQYQELADQLKNVTTQIGKVGDETKTLLDKVTDLETALADAKNVSPEVQEAFDALKAQAQTVDDLVPDAALPASAASSAAAGTSGEPGKSGEPGPSGEQTVV